MPADVDELAAEVQDSVSKAVQQQIQAARDEIHASMLQQMQACKEECFASIQKQVHREDTESLALELLTLKRVIHQVQAEVAAIQKVTEQKQLNAEEQKQYQLQDDPQEEIEPQFSGNDCPGSQNSAEHLPQSDHGDSNKTANRESTRSLGYFPLLAVYELEHSLWDYSMLIGLPDVGSLGSTCVLLLMFLNIGVQLCLCMIINDMFTVTVIGTSTLDSMESWRVMYGHSLHYASDATLQPMVDDVCHFTTVSPVGTDAGFILMAIEQYVPSREYYDYQQPVIGPLLPYMPHIGIVLSSLAVLIWSLNLYGEIERVGFQWMAVYVVPVSARTQIDHFQTSSVLVSMSMFRKALAYCTLITEGVVVVLLGFAGVFYIMNTILLTDLLLNCSALAIVLQMDELLAICIPTQCQRLLKSLEPLPRPISLSVKGLSMNAVFVWIMVGPILIVSTVQMVSDAQVLKDTRETICGGEREFVTAVDATGVVTASRSPEVKDLSSSYYYKAVQQIIHGDSRIVEGPLSAVDMSAFANSVSGGPWSLQAWTSLPVEDAMNVWNGYCEDMLPADSFPSDYAVQFARILRDALGSDIQSCSEVRPWCSIDDTRGMRARQICPVTCGCNTADYTLVLEGSTGCPKLCSGLNAYNTSLWSRECTDLDKRSSVFDQYALSLESMMKSLPGMYNESTLARIRDSGCSIVSMGITLFNIRWANLCEVSANRLKPFTYACPVSCNCTSNPRYLCPNKCSQ